MSNVSLAAFSMERYLQDMPYEILYEIFRTIPKGRLFELSKLCSKFKDIAGDKRLWKDVYIRYETNEQQARATFAFEELFPEFGSVKAIDFSRAKVKAKISHPVSSQADQVVKVTKLVLSSFTGNKVTIEAILTKYQCTELYLSLAGFNCNVFETKPEAFLKQTSLEVLSLKGEIRKRDNHRWLVPVLNYCKNLKTLDLRGTSLTELDTLNFINNLPTSLEKLSLGSGSPAFSEDLFFEMLARRIPNMRELGLNFASVRKCSSLLKFRLLEILQVFNMDYYEFDNISDFHTYLMKFPALQAVYIVYRYEYTSLKKESVEKLRRTLAPHGIIVRLIKKAEEGPSVDDIYLKVTKNSSVTSVSLQ